MAVAPAGRRLPSTERTCERANFFLFPAPEKTRPETVSCKFHCSVFYKYFRSRESMVGLSHSSGDRVVVSVVVAIHDRVENG